MLQGQGGGASLLDLGGVEVVDGVAGAGRSRLVASSRDIIDILLLSGINGHAGLDLHVLAQIGGAVGDPGTGAVVGGGIPGPVLPITTGEEDLQVAVAHQDQVGGVIAAAVGKLALAVVAQAPDPAGGLHVEQVLIPGKDGLPLLAFVDDDRLLGHLAHVVAAQLAHGVQAPTQHGVGHGLRHIGGIGFILDHFSDQGKGGILTRGDVHNIGQVSVPTGAILVVDVCHDLPGHIGIRLGPDAKLAVAVAADRPDTAVGVPCQEMVLPCHDLEQRHFLGSHIAGIILEAGNRSRHRAARSDLPELAA